MTSVFEAHFQALYGERWSTLKAALLGPDQKVSRPCFGTYATYVLDSASVTVASLLPVNPGDQVLDMCAAPGGKALVILEKLAEVNGNAEGGALFANELSFARRKRLEDVVRSHVPSQVQAQVRVTGWDASTIGIKAKERYDQILLDAPCSSERHLLEQDPTMSEWKISRTKQLSQRQYTLICSAMLALKPQGSLLYSTCSISPLENDGVVERLLERKSDQIELDSALTENALQAKFPETHFEKTKFGFQIFPDLNSGQGPLYFSRLVKKGI